MIGMDDTGPERDGRNVPFSGGAQAENEPQGSSWKTGLIGMRHDGGIEQRSGFQRVFGEEIGPDQQLSLFGEGRIRQYHRADLFEPFSKELPDLLMPPRELGGGFL